MRRLRVLPVRAFASLLWPMCKERMGGMSVLYLISLLFTPWYEKTVHHNIALALFCIADALWLAVISKILGWW